ncbi:MAG: hypothetical protein GXY86_00660 [Firmicutes bacterium]|nr:hypothetical protein [Bacillota bacterium]
MSKGAQAKTSFDKDRYWSGVFTGVFLGCFIIFVTIFLVVRVQGLKVAINPQKIAQLMQAKIQSEVKREIPKVLEQLEKELPQEITDNLGGLDDLTIGFGKSQVSLPVEMIDAVRGEFNRVIEAAIINTFNNYNTTDYEERIGKNAYDMIESMLRQDIIGKTYLIKTNEWFAVPVKIVGTSKYQVSVGI